LSSSSSAAAAIPSLPTEGREKSIPDDEYDEGRRGEEEELRRRRERVGKR
jgi:hypothetical protein